MADDGFAPSPAPVTATPELSVAGGGTPMTPGGSAPATGSTVPMASTSPGGGSGSNPGSNPDGSPSPAATR